jgi:WD40 repeat protein
VHISRIRGLRLASFALGALIAAAPALTSTASASAEKPPFGVSKGEGNVAHVLELTRGALAMAASPDGKLLALGSSRDVFLFDFERLAIKRMLEFGKGDVRGLAFSADGSALAIAAIGKIGVVEVATGKVRWQGAGHPPTEMGRGYRSRGGAYAVGFLGPRVVTIESHDAQIRSWDAASGKAGPTMSPGIGTPTHMDVARDGSKLAVSDDDGNIVVLDAAGSKLGAWRERGIGPSVAFSPDGKTLLVSRDAGGSSGVVRALATGESLVSLPAAGSGGLRGLSWTPDGKGVVTAAARRGIVGVIHWKLGGKEPVREVLDAKFTAEEDVDRGVVIGAGGALAAVCGGKVVRIYRLR